MGRNDSLDLVGVDLFQRLVHRHDYIMIQFPVQVYDDVDPGGPVIQWYTSATC